jgi:hypothetical protein
MLPDYEATVVVDWLIYADLMAGRAQSVGLAAALSMTRPYSTALKPSTSDYSSIDHS